MRTVARALKTGEHDELAYMAPGSALVGHWPEAAFQALGADFDAAQDEGWRTKFKSLQQTARYLTIAAMAVVAESFMRCHGDEDQCHRPGRRGSRQRSLSSPGPAAASGGAHTKALPCVLS